MILPLRYENDPILETVCSPVDVFDSDLNTFATNMYETMMALNGLGLAAPQVGELKRIIVVAYDPFVLVNPRYKPTHTEMQKHIEGCLSFPRLFLEIERYQSIKVEYDNLQGVSAFVFLAGRQAVAIQHEVDHLDGIVFTKHVKQMALLLARKQMNK